MSIDFEYEEAKSVANERKHGIDFAKAQALWKDEGRMEIRARAAPEERWMVTGCLDRACWTAVITYRGERIRIISVRKARKEEQKRYEEKNYH